MSKRSDEQTRAVLEANGLTFEQRVEAMLWGNTDLGVVGLRDQTKELRRMLVRNFVANGIIIVAVTAHIAGLDDLALALLSKLLGLP